MTTNCKHCNRHLVVKSKKDKFGEPENVWMHKWSGTRFCMPASIRRSYEGGKWLHRVATPLEGVIR